ERAGARLAFGKAQNIFNRSDSGERFLAELTQFEGKRPDELAVDVDRAPAHSSNHARVLHFWAQELYQDDRLLRRQKIRHHPDHYQIELFDLVACKNRVSLALHSGLNLRKRKNLRVGGKK